MPKITFVGAGSSVFAKNILGDVMCTPSLQDSQIALYDIDATRLDESRRMLETINRNINQGRAKIAAYLGVSARRAALKGANYVVNAIQVGGYKPSTVIDFEIPKKYGLKQTIADTLGIGGIFRALRTIPVLLDIAADMQAVCPNAWFLNYSNPMAMLTAAMLRGSSIRTVGLCHSVQSCASGLLGTLGLSHEVEKVQWKIAGINHQAWLLEITDRGHDLYPEIKRRAAALLAQARKPGGPKYWDMVRHYLMLHFGYYITESSEHNAEYVPYFIKQRFPKLIEEFDIPIDEYLRRCVDQIARWKKTSADLVSNPTLTHSRTGEYGSYIMEAMETDIPTHIGGNVMNTGLITNLPAKAAVEVACLVDRNGVQGCHVGDLPEACAALNRNCINPQILTVEAALGGVKDYVYQAAMLDPHTAAELTIDQIRSMCDDLFEAHGDMIPPMRPLPVPAKEWKPTLFGAARSEPARNWRLSRLQKMPAGGLEAAPAVRLADRKQQWAKLESKTLDGFADVHRLLGDRDGLFYFGCRMSVAKSGKWVLALGHDGGAAMFVDGKRVLLDPKLINPARPGRSKATVSLTKGVHEIVIAFDTANGAGWGVFLHCEACTKKAGEFPKFM
jgi:alpha-galactosidase